MGSRHGRSPEAARGALGPGELRLELPGTLDYVDPVEQAAERLARARGLPEAEAFFLRVALHEALLNAVLHGCGCDPRRRVRFSLRVAAGALRLSVADDGPGFDPRRLADPRGPAGLLRGGGRGVFFMRRFADRVLFRFPPGGGTVVLLRKRLPG